MGGTTTPGARGGPPGTQDIYQKSRVIQIMWTDGRKLQMVKCWLKNSPFAVAELTILPDAF